MRGKECASGGLPRQWGHVGLVWTSTGRRYGLLHLGSALACQSFKTGDGTPAKVLGALFVEISGFNQHREEVLSKQLMYFREGIYNIYLSKEQYPAWQTGP